MYFSFGISDQLIDSSRVLFDSFRQPQPLNLFQNRSVAGMYMRVGVVSVGMFVAVSVCVMGMFLHMAVSVCIVGMFVSVAVSVCVVGMFVAVGVCILGMFVAVGVCVVGMCMPVAVSVCIVGMFLLKVMSICTVCVDVLRQLCVLLRMDMLTGNRTVCMCMRSPLLLPVDGNMHMCAGNAAFFHGFRCDFNPVWGKSFIHGL